MSDFLSKFSKDTYDKDDMKKESPSPEEVKKEKPKEPELKPVPKKEVEKVKTIEEPVVEEVIETVVHDDISEDEVSEELDEVIENSKKLSLDEARKDDRTSGGEEEVEIDPEYKNKKRKQQILIGAGVAVFLVICGFIYYFASYVKLPDFAGKPLTELQTWAKDNKMTIDSTPEYTIEYDKNVVMVQETKANKKIKKGSKIKVTVSQGADPDQVVKLPKFEDMKLEDINKWIETNRMDNVRVIQEYSDSVAKDAFMKLEIRDKDVTAENFKRKNGANVYVSKGKESFEANIKVLNFKGKTKGEVDAWHKEQKFASEFVFEEAYDSKIEAGMVISQSVSEDTMVAKDQVITFVISKGKALYVPDYSGTTLNTFESVNTEGINIVKREWYHPTAEYGAFLEQSMGAGTNLSDDQGAMVEVYYSIGRPYISSLSGKNEGELPAYFYDFSSKGAYLTYSVTYVSDCNHSKGEVVSADKENQFVDRNSHINIVVSSGGSGCPEIPKPETPAPTE